MIDVFDSPKFLHPRAAIDVAPIRAAVLYLGYGLLLVSFLFPWATLRFGDTTVTEYAFGTGFAIHPLGALFFFALTVYGFFAPFHRLRMYLVVTIRAYSFLLGTLFFGWGLNNVKYHDPRLGSYLAIAGGIAIAGVNLVDLLIDKKLVGVIEHKERKKEEKSHSKDAWGN